MIPPGADILVPFGFLHRVVHREIIGHRQLAAAHGKLHECVAEITLRGEPFRIEGCIEGSVACEQIDIPGIVGRRTISRHPDRALGAVGSEVERRCLLKR